TLNGNATVLKTPEAAIHTGLAYVTEDRKTNGLLLNESIRMNTTLARLDKITTRGIIDEPTRGIDVGAKYDIYCLINGMVEQGKSVIMISSEMPELLGMCDRIYVMNEGKILAELNAKEATQEIIMGYILRDSQKIA
ncbi:MAG: sugar ABC transporter ATP-binding protein, partial [Synergistaceae bacterium]|nr:sugar ABC transporter ATP-binding protein [Synergistaceae bacterium]